MLRRVFSSLALITAVGLCTATRASAQITEVPNTGCPGALYPAPTADHARIGQRFGVDLRACTSDDHCLPLGMLIGVTRRPYVTFVPPFACQPGCVLGVEQILGVPPIVRTTLPDDPGIVGSCVSFQGVCVDVRNLCICLSGVLRVCIEGP